MFLFVAVGNTALGEVVGGEFHGDTVTGEDTDAVAAQLAGEMRQDDALLLEQDTEESTGELFDHGSGHFDAIFFTHCPPRQNTLGATLLKPITQYRIIDLIYQQLRIAYYGHLG